MRKNRTSKFLNFLNAWSIYVKKNRLVLIISIISLAIASLFFIKNNLAFSTSTSDMLSEKLHWRQLDIKYEESFPQFLNLIDDNAKYVEIHIYLTIYLYAYPFIHLSICLSFQMFHIYIYMLSGWNYEYL